ncbi:hypothetical protein MTR67_005617 [Solanum verrucosum]|uniref:Uncharacterized protein n=4 Tax=Solanum TaxID=4107 RepID=A0ABQ7WQY6_SOLTU|nr:hypothetical protein H5410_011071 [Solanum commersonii]KAH0766825.1 hypothetical protein KY285_002696 [Solanum tuberosum]KAH0783162.1 hypothetical protein KY290_002760 [Solanum tuberosum]WMV12232.1 hypothetical protein MTR67_005617 [Solanum verrucosum]
MWWVVPSCTSRSSKNFKTQPILDIEEILKMKLETIKEEPEISEENVKLTKTNTMSKQLVKKIQLKVKKGRIFSHKFSLKECYVLFMTGLATKGALNGLPRY